MRLDLHGPPQTMLATLYAKALDADLPKPILGDRYAKEVVERIDYDWSKTTITPRNSTSVTTRTAHFDIWVRQFLVAHPRAVVLHVGCGLDSRYFRLQPGPQVQWYDIDYPEVADLCTRLYPATEHRRVVATAVTDPAWVAEIPNDRPTLMIGEGLTMYLDEPDGVALLRRVVERFHTGEIQFDAFNRLAIKSQWINAVVRRSGSTLRWGIDAPADILAAVPGTRLLSWQRWFESETFARLPPVYQALGRAMSVVPAAANMSQYHRYAFGPP
ncbi:class I SAM-dependent methyltransferase [Mycobacterium sp. 852002-10029_SCH5224772]|uniref:class I SAM-dependent methyltransferase n=1 Tax=Mycobacterium sp. 852002-10029_SCH5224772 TaxID=1834083 RepID=UPI0007FD079D|nr:class I SAM-dependent methyltransferase [Mycobacterium sp. 852002-10029_SCH5224772]OBE97680.1 methyltransferase [Mycobacterium sp. 852002-10029_SCH5224772]